MTPIASTQLLDALNWRYATKKFDSAKKIPADVWTTLEHSLVLAPSSFGLQPWKFIVIQDQAVKEKLVPVSWGQKQISECSHLVVFTVRKDLPPEYVAHNMQRAAEVRGVPVESLDKFAEIINGYARQQEASGNLRNWQTRQVYIALGQFMAVAALLGVDTCPMEGIDPAKYDEVLGLTSSDFATVVACPAGYRAADDKYGTLPKVRFPASEVIQHL